MVLQKDKPGAAKAHQVLLRQVNSNNDCYSTWCITTSSGSATAEGPRDTLSQFESCQLLHKYR